MAFKTESYAIPDVFIKKINNRIPGQTEWIKVRKVSGVLSVNNLLNMVANPHSGSNSHAGKTASLDKLFNHLCHLMITHEKFILAITTTSAMCVDILGCLSKKFI